MMRVRFTKETKFTFHLNFCPNARSVLEDFLLPFQATAFYPTVKVELGGVRGTLQYFALRLGHTAGFANDY